VDPCRIFSGTASHKLTTAICTRLRVPVGDAVVSRFEDGEVSVRFNENIRGSDVFIVQSTNAPADHLMELLVMLDAAKRASARRVTAVLPYFGYARQDRKDQPRAPITAKLVANLITVAGADRALTMDLHSAQIQGFFDIPLDHLYAAPVLIDHFAKLDIPNLVVVAPDIGSVKMARAYAKRLGADLALVDKRRPRADAVEIMNIIGDVEGKNAVLFDDLVTTARTLCHGGHRDPRPRRARHLRRRHARRVLPGFVRAHRRPPRSRRSWSPTRSITSRARSRRRSASSPWPPSSARPVQRIHEERSLSSLFV
jgi:ribose-phosphate pyrophosphokinase